jgi:hypothetical protein
MIIQGQDYIWQRILVKPNCFKSKYYIEEKMQGANNRYILKTNLQQTTEVVYLLLFDSWKRHLSGVS